MKRGRPRLDGLDDLLPGKNFVRECIRSLAVGNHFRGTPLSGPGRPRRSGPNGRDQDFHSRFKQGWTLAEIGALHGVSRERVRQCLTRWWGITADDGGASFRATIKAMDRAQSLESAREAQCLKTFGVPEGVFCEITGLTSSRGAYSALRKKTSPILVAYLNQARTAKARGIAWNFTLATWWEVWTESGHWAERGRGAGYVMARWGDSGPYSPDNIYICTASQNSKDSYIVKPVADRVAKRRANQALANGR